MSEILRLAEVTFAGFDAVHLPGIFAAVGIGVGPDEPLSIKSFDVEGEPAVAVRDSVLYNLGTVIHKPLTPVGVVHRCH